MTKQISFNYIKNQLGDYYGFNVFCDYRNKTIEALVGFQTDYEAIEIKEDTEFHSTYGKWRYETEINDPENKSFIVGMPKYEFIKDYKYAFCFEDYDDTVIFFKTKERFIQFKKELLDCLYKLLTKLHPQSYKLYKDRMLTFLDNLDFSDIKNEYNKYYPLIKGFEIKNKN